MDQKILLAAFLAVLMFVSSCGLAKDQVATVGSGSITLQAMQMAYAALPSSMRIRANSLEGRKWLLNYLIRQKVLAQAAERAGMSVSPISTSTGVSPEIQKSLMYRFRLESQFRPSDERVRTYYEQQRVHFEQPLESGRHIIGATMVEAQSAQSMLQYGVSFEEVAWRTYGLKERPNGDLSVLVPFRKGERTPAFEAAFFSLKPGQRSGIIEVLGQYEIIQRGKPEPPPPYPVIAEQIRHLLTEVAVEREIDRLVATASVKIDEKKLANIQF